MQTTKLSQEDYNRQCGKIIRELRQECNILAQEDNLHQMFIGYLESRGAENDENIRCQYVILRTLLRNALKLETDFYHQKQHT